MLRRFLAVLVVSALAVTGLTAAAAPASAAAVKSQVFGNIYTQGKLNAVAREMAKEAAWSTTGCALNKSVDQVVKIAKTGKTVPVQLARLAVKAANTNGNGFCRATFTIGVTIAYMAVTFAVHKRVFVKQTVERGKYPWSKITVTRNVGKTSNSTVKFSYAA